MSNRRGFMKRASGVAVAAAAVPAAAALGATPAAADADSHRGCRPKKEVHWLGPPPENPLFSPIVTFGNMVFISGIGAHFEGDITAHTTHVLNEVERYLKSVGSSMEQVMKVNVYLNDLADYDGMNAVFRGRFGKEPGVRTTIAAAAGIPGNSLVEIDCIACR